MTEKSCNIVGLVQETAQRIPNKTALIAPDGERITFGSLWDQVCRLDASLRAAGLQPGNRVIVMIPMSIPLYQVLLAIIKSGAVAVFVDPWMPMARIAQFAAFAEPTGFVGVGKSHLLRMLQRTLRHLPITVTTGCRLGGIPARYTLHGLEHRDPLADVWEPDSADAPALITFTSGSSGTPKGANRTHGFLAAQYEALCNEYHYEDKDVDLPMFPVFALRNLASGITSVIPDMDFRNVAAVDGERIAEQVRQHGVTTCTASPPFIQRLAQVPNPPRGLRRILTGGAPVTDGSLALWRKAFPTTDVSVVYGSTEAEPVACISLEDRLSLEGEGCCVGHVVPAVSARVIRICTELVTFRAWEELAPGEDGIGELVVSGDHVCRDYFRNTEAVAENKFVDDTGKLWHRMGDTGYFDSEDRFWLVGRVHSTIFCKAAPLHPQLLEAKVASLLTAAERVAALEVRESLVIVVQGNTVQGFKERLQEHGIPADYVYFTRRALPLDPRHQSKIDYAALRIQLLNSPLRF